MSVMACNRHGCGNILCDRRSFEHGYLCNSCFKELVEAGPVKIDNFMESWPGSYVSGPGWEAFCTNEFRLEGDGD